MPGPEYPGLPAENGQICQERLIAILSLDNEMIGTQGAPYFSHYLLTKYRAGTARHPWRYF